MLRNGFSKWPRVTQPLSDIFAAYARKLALKFYVCITIPRAKSSILNTGELSINHDFPAASGMLAIDEIKRGQIPCRQDDGCAVLFLSR
jgi:hypothetical protein